VYRQFTNECGCWPLIQLGGSQVGDDYSHHTIVLQAGLA